MPRKVAFSAKQKRAYLHAKRAEKRGEIELPKGYHAFSKFSKAHLAKSDLTVAQEAAKLQSKFIALTDHYIEQSRLDAWNDTLQRPIPAEQAVFNFDAFLPVPEDGSSLSVPKRPGFKQGQSKQEVEKNEEAMFSQWREDTEAVVRAWVEGGDELRSPSWFETNLEVWRQLWRVTESSQIILLLLDSRCPPIHVPPSLKSYIKSFQPRREVVLVLTKADLVDPAALVGWKAWARAYWGQDVEVVGVVSYDTEALYDRKTKLVPSLPPHALDDLIAAIQRAHARLRSPPQDVKCDPESLNNWKPNVRKEVDWESLKDPHYSNTWAYYKAHSTAISSGFVKSESEEGDEGNVASHEQEHDQPSAVADPAHPHDPENELLSIGILGQPNVGKSSLLNALFGTTKVRASRTPGKTKHFQTIFWGKHVRLIDCPGLVCPSLVRLELQALAGIIPISQIPSLMACIHFASKLLPVEDIFRIPPPEPEPEVVVVDKRTWRVKPAAPMETSTDAAPESEQQRPVSSHEKSAPLQPPADHSTVPALTVTGTASQKHPRPIKWTAGLLIERRAKDRGYTTAKSSWPDMTRASDGMMRALAEGKVRWGFWPPTATAEDSLSGREGTGIWIGEKYEETKERPAVSGEEESSGTEMESREEDEDDDNNYLEFEEEDGEVGSGGMFAALAVDGGDEGEVDDGADVTGEKANVA